MVRVPLPFRGVAVLLLAASTVVGQTPEPPAELPLEPSSPHATDFLRQYSGDSHHPLLSLLVEGDLTSLDASPAPSKESSSRLAPTPQSGSTKPALTEVPPGAIEVGSGACEMGSGACAIECPTMPTCLPFCPPPPPPCHCRKCQRAHKHGHCGNYGPGYGGNYGGNPYLNWPGGMGGCPGCYGPAPYACPSQGCCSHKRRHKHGCGYDGPMYPGCGYPYGGGCGSGYGGGYGGGYGMGYGGFMDGGCGGCMPYIAPPPPPPPPPCWCHKCQRKHGRGHQGCGYAGCGYGGGYGGYGGGWGMMGEGGFMDGGFGGCCAPCAPPPPPPCPCRKCQRKHGCSQGYGYAGCGYPGWPAYPVPGWSQWEGGYNNCGQQSCRGGCCKRRGCWSHHGHGCQQPAPYPYWAYPQASPCMMGESFCGECGLDGGFGSAPLMGGGYQ